jgi:predicted RNA-binding protein
LCEFKVLLNGELIMEDVTYVRLDGNKVILRDIVGDMKAVMEAEIVEVNVLTTELKIRHKL